SYETTMPLCDVVVCHAGHGTVARALASGVPVVACPAAGDMAEDASRVAWAGGGVPVRRRLVSGGAVRLGGKRELADGAIRGRAAALGDWASRHKGGVLAVDLLESLIESVR